METSYKHICTSVCVGSGIKFFYNGYFSYFSRLVSACCCLWQNRRKRDLSQILWQLCFLNFFAKRAELVANQQLQQTVYANCARVCVCVAFSSVLCVCVSVSSCFVTLTQSSMRQCFTFALFRFCLCLLPPT